MLCDQIKPFIPAIVRRELTNRALARHLGVSESHLCRVLKQLNVVRDPAPTRENQRALIEARHELRADLANDTNLTVAEAARKAGCSTRTIYRYRNAR